MSNEKKTKLREPEKTPEKTREPAAKLQEPVKTPDDMTSTGACDENHISAGQFLNLLFGNCTEGYVTVTTLPDRKSEHIPVTKLSYAAERIGELGRGANTYYGTALRNKDLGQFVRGGAQDIHSVVCFYADIDIKGPAHKVDALPETEEDVTSFLDALQMKPSILIGSGNGIHAIWLLTEPYVIRSEEDRRKIQEISAGFGAFLIREGRERGWQLDNVQDIARMLRAPGTLNFKSDPARECVILRAEDTRYPLASFEPYRKAVDEAKSEWTQGDGIVGSAEKMCGKCAFVDFCREHQNEVSEPRWHAFLSIVAASEDGEEKCHEWSREYAGYSYEETQERYERARKMNRPCSCRYVRDILGFACPEGGCGVKAPIVFSYYNKEEQISRLLEQEVLTLDEMFSERVLMLAEYARQNLPAQYVRLKKKFGRAGVGVRELEKAMRKAVFDHAAKSQTSAQEDFAEYSAAGLALDGIDTTGLIVPGGWRVDGTGIMKETSAEGIPVVQYICRAPVFISRKLASVDDPEIKLELCFRWNHMWKKVILPRGDAMDRNRIIKYAGCGLPATSGNALELVKYLEAFEARNIDTIPMHRSIERMGWVGKKEFFPYRMSGAAVYDGAGEESRRIISAVTAQGDKAIWLSMAAKLRTVPVARAMLAAAFASVLLEPLQHRPFIVHLWSASRSGKTAVLKAGVSIYGDPAVLLKSYNTTVVGIERMAGTMRNLPLALDELQSFSMKFDNLSRLVYMLGNGFGKVRGDRTGGTQKMEYWRNTTLSTGEQSLLFDNSMDGESTRVLELYAPPVEDTDFAREIHQVTAEHYGFAGQMFLDFLFNSYGLSGKGAAGQTGTIDGADQTAQTGADGVSSTGCTRGVVAAGKKDGTLKLREDYQAFRDDFKSTYEMLFDCYAGVHFDNVAVILFADYLASQAVFDVPEGAAGGEAYDLGFTLLEMLKKQTGEDVVDRAWNTVQDWVASNKEHFERKLRGCSTYTNGYSPLYGRYNREKKVLYILPSILKEMLADSGFSYEKCIRGFKERGYVEPAQAQQRVGGSSVKVYAANIEIRYEEFEEFEVIGDGENGENGENGVFAGGVFEDDFLK